MQTREIPELLGSGQDESEHGKNDLELVNHICPLCGQGTSAQDEPLPKRTEGKAEEGLSLSS